ncbi:hypothetical protein AVEN_215556-1 [Araneus ventricosus]|uniref:Tc1-like transposase DDE domain-containing protein n=1 Tax=Araneus ventricosus TaxID=182803 RepID=A0A4Y2BI45_ARAVE|nr:hypothetical protein AVEN_215556-1 [Araneus ventricosus]
MKAANYLNITADQLQPYMAFVFPTGNEFFQYDNAPCHKARIVLEWFVEHTDEFHLMSCPPNLPDLYPIEDIWDVMERSSELKNHDVQISRLCVTAVRHLVQPVSSHVPKTCGIYAQASCSCSEGQRRHH